MARWLLVHWLKLLWLRRLGDRTTVSRRGTAKTPWAISPNPTPHWTTSKLKTSWTCHQVGSKGITWLEIKRPQILGNSHPGKSNHTSANNKNLLSQTHKTQMANNPKQKMAVLAKQLDKTDHWRLQTSSSSKKVEDLHIQLHKIIWRRRDSRGSSSSRGVIAI